MKKLFLFILFPILTYGQVQIGQDIDGSSNTSSASNVSISSDGNILAIGAVPDFGKVQVYENQK